MKKLLLPLFTILALNSYSQLTYVPDDAFEAYLENYIGVSNGVTNDNYVLTAGMSGIIYMTIVPNNIADFTGIEECVNLAKFTMMNNDVVNSLDLSSSQGNLESLAFDLQVIGCYNLQNLILPDTLLKLTVSDNFNLTTISSSPNTVLAASLFVGGNNSLESFDISDVEVQSSFISLTTLQIVGNSNLSCLYLDNGFCSVWTSVAISGNPLLYCIQVDDPNYSMASWVWQAQLLSPQDYSYSTNCTNDCSVGINEADMPSLSIYPNPSNTGLINLNTSIVNSDIKIYSIEGKQINFTQSINIIDISNNEKGVYLISIDGKVIKYLYQD